MMLSEILFFGIVFYLVYRFLFNFLLPVLKSTRAFREQFRTMRDQMNSGNPNPGNPGNPFQQFHARQNAPQTPPSGATPKKPDPSQASKTGEYIDFEEIK